MTRSSVARDARVALRKGRCLHILAGGFMKKMGGRNLPFRRA